ncbi:hypothetical protein TNCV_2412061 [Trichonephila clavipes]|nr:hypothetical protein TNCV_2412061 [Trichonephila clavipes]
MVPEEEILEIEVRGAWRPSNSLTTSNPPPVIGSMEKERTAIDKCSSVSSCMNHTYWYAVQQHWEKRKICIRASFFRCNSVLQFPTFVRTLHYCGSSPSRRLLLSRFPPTKCSL